MAKALPTWLRGFGDFGWHGRSYDGSADAHRSTVGLLGLVPRGTGGWVAAESKLRLKDRNY